jgi:hypothetical protein
MRMRIRDEGLSSRPRGILSWYPGAVMGIPDGSRPGSAKGTVDATSGLRAVGVGVGPAPEPGGAPCGARCNR